jgi:hypothetical protein
MITETTITIDATAATVWEVFADPTNWPDWTDSVTKVVGLDGPHLEVGARFKITQPRFPALVWTVTALEPGHSWTWRQRSPGGTTDAFHEITPLDDGRTLVKQGVDQRGPIGRLVGILMRRLTRRYLDAEAEGLKARVEAGVASGDAPAS